MSYTIELIKAWNLPAAGHHALSPYVRLSMTDSMDTLYDVGKTKVIHKESHPCWNEKIEVPRMISDTLTIDVYSHEPILKDIHLCKGSCSLSKALVFQAKADASSSHPGCCEIELTPVHSDSSDAQAPVICVRLDRIASPRSGSLSQQYHNFYIAMETDLKEEVMILPVFPVYFIDGKPIDNGHNPCLMLDKPDFELDVVVLKDKWNLDVSSHYNLRLVVFGSNHEYKKGKKVKVSEMDSALLLSFDFEYEAANFVFQYRIICKNHYMTAFSSIPPIDLLYYAQSH